jgi:hypothetical protein
MKIGFSLSFCIRDICIGKVDVEDVHHIFSGASPETNEDLQAIEENYLSLYWKAFPEKARLVFAQLQRERKISWTSKFQRSSASIFWGHWLDLPFNVKE